MVSQHADVMLRDEIGTTMLHMVGILSLVVVDHAFICVLRNYGNVVNVQLL